MARICHALRVSVTRRVTRRPLSSSDAENQNRLGSLFRAQLREVLTSQQGEIRSGWTISEGRTGDMPDAFSRQNSGRKTPQG